MLASMTPADAASTRQGLRCLAQVQTIGFLAHLRSIHSHGPYLVVGPLSTLSNWKAEFERWLPDMPCVLYHGSKAQREELRRSRMPTGACVPIFVCHPG